MDAKNDQGRAEGAERLGDRRGITRKNFKPERLVDRWFAIVPYGMWTCRDGREVLFNRFYGPIAERDGPQAPARSANASEWVRWRRQEHYFHDGSFKPRELAATMMKLNAILSAWGLPRLSQPPR